MGITVNAVKSLDYGHFTIRNHGLSSCKSNTIMKSIDKSGLRENLGMHSKTCPIISECKDIGQGIV